MSHISSKTRCLENTDLDTFAKDLPSTMASTTTSGTVEMWRSRLGTNYKKEFMQRNEANLFKELQALRDLPENRVCADCGVRGTVWASVNLGVFLCMTCGSHHRSLGTHISLPKECTGTYWWGPDEIERMKSIGNARAGELYGNMRPNGLSTDDAFRWKEYLMDKYVNKKFVPTNPPGIAVLNPASPRGFSPKTKKFTKQHMPDIDLIHFDSSSPQTLDRSPPSTSPKGVVQQTYQGATGFNFFAQFGV
jgi:hypothetical protein